MSTATATKLSAFNGVKEFLKHNNVERDEEIELCLLALISGVDILLLGAPGVGKTHLIELLTEHCISDATLFTHLLAKDQSADELLGPRDIMAMKAGKIARITEGMLPQAHFAYLDEIFKASAPTLNPLLDLTANRVLKVGGQVIDCSQLITIFASSNELPEREDLSAFRDRIGITKIVEPVKTTNGRYAVTSLQLDYQLNGLDTATLVPLSLQDIHDIRAEVAQVKVPGPMRDNMVAAQETWQEMATPPSQRRVGQIWKAIKAHAWSCGRSEVVGDDFVVASFMAWSDPDDQAAAREVVLEFLGAGVRMAQRFRDALDPIVVSADELKSKLDGAGDEAEREALINDGFKLIRQIRKLKKDVMGEMQDRTEGEVKAALDDVLTKVISVDEWLGKSVIGE